MPSNAEIDREVERQVRLIAGRVAEIVPEEELRAKIRHSLLVSTPLRVKYGIDPTNPDIHIGHLVPCRVLRLFQDLGHTAVLIIGDYTARIGDPSGRNAERPGLSEQQVTENMRLYAEQLFSVVDPDRAEVCYQSEWFADITLDETLRMLARFSIAQMLAHDTFRRRLDDGGRLSLHELVYPAMQAHDSVQVGADVEIGGTDQKFNCLCGRDMQRSLGQSPQVVVTVPLLKGPDGQKMSKSLDNHVPVSASAREIIGRVMSVPDELLEQYITLATDWTDSRRAEAVASLSGGANPRDVKLSVARAIAGGLVGESEAKAAADEFVSVFSRGAPPTDLRWFEVRAGTIGIIDLLTRSGLASSRSEARRLVEQGGVRVDDCQVRGLDQEVRGDRGKERILRVGRRRFLGIRF